MNSEIGDYHRQDLNVNLEKLAMNCYDDVLGRLASFLQTSYLVVSVEFEQLVPNGICVKEIREETSESIQLTNDIMDAMIYTSKT